MDRQLIDYLPDVIKDSPQYRAILDGAGQSEISNMWGEYQNAFDNQFLNYAGEEGISRFEKILGIIPNIYDTLEDRRLILISRINETLPYTIQTLRRMIAALLGDDTTEITQFENDYMIRIGLRSYHLSKTDIVVDLTKRIIPANLTVTVVETFRMWGNVANMTWGEVSPLTWQQLKEF